MVDHFAEVFPILGKAELGFRVVDEFASHLVRRSGQESLRKIRASAS